MKILFMNCAEIVTVSKLMGLNSSKTTEIFTHVNTKNIYHIKSPFDYLKKHIFTECDLTSHILLTYIQLV
jgi:site-specific recombinase XerD